MGTYKENLLAISSLDMAQITTLLSAALKATQYNAFENRGEKFQLLEGFVRKNDKGEYIFTPSQSLQQLLDHCPYPLLLKQEESRFIKLIALALEGGNI